MLPAHAALRPIPFPKIPRPSPMQLTRPISFFDLETTAVSTTTDRIVQIDAIKIMPDGTKEEKSVLVNPGTRWCRSCENESYGIKNNRK